VLSFVGILGGLIVAGLLFYLYQSPKTRTGNIKHVSLTPPASPTPTPSVFLNIDSPADESVVATRSITISGKTIPGSTVVVSTPSSDQISSSSASGSFQLATSIDDGANEVTITAILPGGEEVTKKLTVTYSVNNF